MYTFQVQCAQDHTYLIAADYVDAEKDGTVFLFKASQVVAIFNNPIAVIRVS